MAGVKGFEMKKRKDLKKKLNLNYLYLTNKTTCYGELGLPKLVCNTKFIPDYIALSGQPCEYFRTKNTIVAFNEYDNAFNGKNGLYYSIYFNDKKCLERLKQKYKGIKYFIMPDISNFGDVQPYENHHRMGQARKIALWLNIENHSIVIPFIGCGSRRDFRYMIEGLEDVSVVAFSTKGKVNDEIETKLLIDTIKYTVDNLKKLKRIIVYDVCKDNSYVDEIFKYAKEKGIDIVVPNNILKLRNQVKSLKTCLEV